MIFAIVLLLAACGGNDAADTGSDGATTEAGSNGSIEGDSGASSSGAVVDPQPPGQALVSVDGQEFMFDTLGPSDCIVESDGITFAFVDNETSATLSAGANLTDDGWQGDILLRILDEDGLPVQYSLRSEEGLMIPGAIIVDGDSMSFSGPMTVQPPNDGSNPPVVDVGHGTISATCG